MSGERVVGLATAFILTMSSGSLRLRIVLPRLALLTNWLRVQAADGSYRWFLSRLNPVHDDNRQITRWYVACTDIEDRKRAEERLQQENIALREEIDKTS